MAQHDRPPAPRPPSPRATSGEGRAGGARGGGEGGKDRRKEKIAEKAEMIRGKEGRLESEAERAAGD